MSKESMGDADNVVDIGPYLSADYDASNLEEQEIGRVLEGFFDGGPIPPSQEMLDMLDELTARRLAGQTQPEGDKPA